MRRRRAPRTTAARAFTAGRRMLNGGCTECSGTPVARHSSSWATEKFETPIRGSASLQQGLARRRGLGDRLRRRPVQLVEIDALDAEPAQAAVALGLDLGGRRRCFRTSLSAPRPNFVKINGRLAEGSCFTARPTTSSECPEP